MKKLFSFFGKDIFKLALGGILFAAALIFDVLSLEITAVCLYVFALIISGCGVYIDAIRGILRRDLLDEKFLMSIASVGAMIIGEFSEGVAVMLFFLLGQIFEHKAVASSRGKIRSLMSICPDEATVIRNGAEAVIDAEDVEIGDELIIRAGERVAVDCEVISGSADTDTSAVTGESVPVSVFAGSKIVSGTIVMNAPIICKAIRRSEDSSAKRILDMVENASENKSREENFITLFSRVYTPIVVILALLLAIIPPIFKLMLWQDSIYRALIFLVVSCPCALVISVPMAFFGGIGAAASEGILFKGGNSFSPVAKVATAAFDKTGTLTKGEFTVKTAVFNTVSKERLYSIAASLEQGSNHPIALCLRSASPDIIKAEGIKELAGKGTVGFIDGKRAAIGNDKLMKDEGVPLPDGISEIKEAAVYCSHDGMFIGAIVITDTVKPEAEKAIKMLRNVGIKRILMLSGDKQERAEQIANTLSIDEFYAELMPDGKYEALKGLIADNQASHKTMFVGDGINDAPALAIADVGVAMGAAGSDSAIETADIVIMSDNLLKLPAAVRIARKTLRIAKENIVFALGVKAAILVLGAFGIANMWLAVFADVGVAVLAILNSMRILYRKARYNR